MIAIQNTSPEILIDAFLEPYSNFNGQIQNIDTKEVYPRTIQDLPKCDIQRIRIVMEGFQDYSLLKYVKSDMKYFFYKDGSAVITSKMATKENALCKFKDYFNIEMTDIIAFGDDSNDIDMIKTAGIGVAMGNAIDEVKSVADFICDTNDADGIAKWISKFLL